MSVAVASSDTISKVGEFDRLLQPRLECLDWLDWYRCCCRCRRWGVLVFIVKEDVSLLEALLLSDRNMTRSVGSKVTEDNEVVVPSPPVVVVVLFNGIIPTASNNCRRLMRRNFVVKPPRGN